MERDEAFMRLALQEAAKAAEEGEVPVGAIVVRGDTVISRAHNRREGDRSALAHAELLAIDAACRTLGGWRLWECELYVTLEPCPMCAGAIINSRLRRVIFGASDPKAGCCGSVLDLFAAPFNHHPAIAGGLLAEESAKMLREFFRSRRERQKKGEKAGPGSEQRESCRLLLFDLDGTLLRSDKTISPATLKALRRCRQKGIEIGVSTARGEQNALPFIAQLQPDVLITSGGALAKYHGEYLYKAEFSPEETQRMIAAAREICGENCEITIDTIDSHFWNYQIDPKKQDKSWGDSIYTDFKDFGESALKMCVEIFEESKARQLQQLLENCDCARFSDGYWYKFTQKAATKERAILRVCAARGIGAGEIIAFGDDYADIGMLCLCGIGVAMGNAIGAVREQADVVIGSNDADGIARYLEAIGL